MRLLQLSVFLALGLLGAGTCTAQAAPNLADGERLAAAGDTKGALAVYQAVVDAEPASPTAHARLGGMQLVEQRYADAVKSFQRAITLGDSEAGAFVGMGMAYLHMGRFGPARAAFVEARSRGVADPRQIDNVIDWIDGREPAIAGPLH